MAETWPDIQAHVSFLPQDIHLYLCGHSLASPPMFTCIAADIRLHHGDGSSAWTRTFGYNSHSGGLIRRIFREPVSF